MHLWQVLLANIRLGCKHIFATNTTPYKCDCYTKMFYNVWPHTWQKNISVTCNKIEKRWDVCCNIINLFKAVFKLLGDKLERLSLKIISTHVLYLRFYKVLLNIEIHNDEKSLFEQNVLAYWASERFITEDHFAIFLSIFIETLLCSEGILWWR